MSLSPLFAISLTGWEWRMAAALVCEGDSDLSIFAAGSRERIGAGVTALNALPELWRRELVLHVLRSEYA